MTVLVTGGAGYIGAHMALALLDAGEAVTIVDDLSTGRREAVPPGAAFVEGDIGDAALMARVFSAHDVDAAIHFAGSVVVSESVADPLAYYLNNTAKSRDFIEAAVRAGVRNVIFSSTAAVYGRPDQSPVSEDAALRPISPYGASKMMTEAILRDAAAAHALRVVILRYFNVAGADRLGRAGQSSPRATHLIKLACEAALGKRPFLSVFGADYPTPDGTCVRDYIDVEDLVSAHRLSLAYLRSGGATDVFNCGASRGVSVREVIASVKRVSGVDFEVRTAPRRAGDPPALVAVSEKIRQRLGWTPAHEDLDATVRAALSWEKSLNCGERPSAGG